MLRRNIYIISLAMSFTAAIIELLSDKRMVVFLPYTLIVPILILIPRFIALTYKYLNKNIDRRLIEAMDLIALGMVTISVPASLWWHKMGFQYDRFLHFAIAAMALPLAIILMASFGWEKKVKSRKGFLALTTILAAAGLFIFEGYQYSVDQIFGTSLFYDSKQHISVDFSEDIIFGVLGILFSLCFLVPRIYLFKK